MQFRIAAVDLVSNTCFPALAADELGYFKAEGLDAHIGLAAMLGATKALREGSADAMIAGSVHDVLTEFPDWQGVKILVALSQGTPWLLTVRADLPAKRGDINGVKGLRITAAQGPDLALKRLLRGAGIEAGRDVEIIELPGAKSRDVSFGVFAARALEARQVDGFWANAMGAETAVSRGAGKVLIDVRPTKCAILHSPAWRPPINSSARSPTPSPRRCGQSSRRKKRCAPILLWRVKSASANFLRMRRN